MGFPKNIICYFAYNSTIDIAKIDGRGVKYYSKETAYIENYQVKFNKRSLDGTGKATIVEFPDSKVFGILYKMDNENFSKIIDIEGGSSGHYNHKKMRVINLNAELFEAEVFIANPKHISVDETTAPSKEYIISIINSGVENNFDSSYIDYIRSYL